ncbi:MAG: cupin domain-containing protein [Bernardetiaceae bacterium]|jgi:hypothetical protein|nr:cupin domain-containing protein [Bernardetiaceae bacterium]
MRTAQYWIDQLNMQAHPEGGWFAETYRSPETVAGPALPARYAGGRSFATAIYFLLTGGVFSAFHRIASDELWHFYEGRPVRVHVIAPDGAYRLLALGPGPGQHYQAVVPAGHWFASEVADPAPAAYALVGCTVAPGFDFADFELAARPQLTAAFPRHAALIGRLTRG